MFAQYSLDSAWMTLRGVCCLLYRHGGGHMVSMISSCFRQLSVQRALPWPWLTTYLVEYLAEVGITYAQEFSGGLDCQSPALDGIEVGLNPDFQWGIHCFSMAWIVLGVKFTGVVLPFGKFPLRKSKVFLFLKNVLVAWYGWDAPACLKPYTS
jgi:hypothetical protein